MVLIWLLFLCLYDGISSVWEAELYSCISISPSISPLRNIRTFFRVSKSCNDVITLNLWAVRPSCSSGCLLYGERVGRTGIHFADLISREISVKVQIRAHTYFPWCKSAKWIPILPMLPQ
jgi:hypothetical protein